MRILNVDTEMGWRGGQQQVLLLARGLACHPGWGGSALTVCRTGSALAARLAAEDLPHTTIAAGSPWSPFAVAALRRVASSFAADLVHAHASHAHTLAALATLGSTRRLIATRRVDFCLL
jgi:hypothetical protein